MINRKQKIGCICSLSLLLVACSGNNDDLVRYIKEVKHRKTREIEPIPSFAPLPTFKFPDSGNRRNPFKPIAQKKEEVDVNAPDKNRPKEPLETYPLDALKFVGTLTQGNEIWALIKLPSSDITHVGIGNYMGQNYGRVVSITNNAIQLIETTQTSGKWEKHKITLELYTGK
ncbi:pilus assembly protein PilP [Legionella anisa]|uniref:Pilus assembly protein PilP n=1 Tax=Legionella anisa TaxID=28082 RepID=A0AAX0WV93_9GAMM|nr:pilus assembly protein PilP [Legionella anisa]AWN73753.1 pilus assembly protein PilP [Legionella anisa]KTC70364.1 Tfp pilus assembly protein PilP [Legionella anisa]MBN5936740.1 pilus assembly protein PilP [Legionella anisa]MCW8426649.1 pilus assembly protein PilP [Legionella anisa]MCW8448312.1 pilus assembly protein PilP [Legionella anisa]